MHDDPTDRFISGVFNYCDRWCERCRMASRCRVHHEEQARLERHLLRGEDPDDPRVVMEDVSDSFSTAFEMLQEMADEAGLDFDNLEELEDEPEEETFNPREHPLHQRASRWSERVGALLRMLRAELPLRPPLDDRVDLPPLPEEPALPAEVLDAVEVLTQYRYFIPVKMARALDGWIEMERGTGPCPEFSGENGRGTAKLVHICLRSAEAALGHVAGYSPSWHEMAEPIRQETIALQAAVDEQFPGHQSFHRPGFDDPPE